MTKKKLCEECDEEDQQGPGSMMDRIWEAQLTNHREIIIDSVIDERVVRQVVVQIQNFNRADDVMEQEWARSGITGFKRDPITVLICSPGGSVDLSFSIVSAIEASKTPVVTVGIGMAMSGGFLILLSGHTRYMQRYASAMYHELAANPGDGRATEVKECAEYLLQLQTRITDYVLNNSDISEEALNECHLRKQDWYMDTFEALELGVIDGIWPPDVYALAEDPEKEETEVLDEECIQCIEDGDDDCDNCEKEDKPE